MFACSNSNRQYLAQSKLARYAYGVVTDYQRLRSELRDNAEELVARWGAGFQCSPLRMPHPVDDREYVNLVSSMMEGLADALPVPGSEPDGNTLRPGCKDLRELERAVAFAGSAMAASRSSAYAVAALLCSLRDVVLDFVEPPCSHTVADLFEWLTVVALDAYANARAISAVERVREQLEQGMPVVMASPEVPAVFLIAAPGEPELDSIFGRVILSAVRVGAKSVVVEATGLSDQVAAGTIAAVRRFSNHRKIQGHVEVIIVGLSSEAEPVWKDAAASTAIHCENRYEDALVRAQKRAGYQLVKR